MEIIWWIFSFLLKVMVGFFEEDKFQIFHLFKLIDMVDVWGKYLIQTRESYLNSKRFKRSLNLDRTRIFWLVKILDLKFKPPIIIHILWLNFWVGYSSWNLFLGSMNLALKLYDLLVQDLSGKIIINYF